MISTTTSPVPPAAVKAASGTGWTPSRITLAVVAVILAGFLAVFGIMVVLAVTNGTMTVDQAKGLCGSVIPAPAVILFFLLFRL